MTEGRNEGSIGVSEKLSKKSAAVLITARSLTPKLTEEHPEIADLYRDTTLTTDEIARKVAPEVADTFPNAARAAVTNALGELIPKEERAAITHKRQQNNLNNKMAALGDEGYRAHQAEAARQRHLKHGVDSEAMTRGRGIVPWTELERQFAFFLRSQQDYQYQSGPNKGHPNQSKIAEALNNTFHKDKSERNRDSIRGLFNDPKFKKTT